MKRVRLAIVALTLAIVMVMPTVVVAAAYEDHPFFRVEDGETFVPLRALVESWGLQVDWDGDNWVVLITTHDGEVIPIPVELVGGFIEDGTSWIPLDFAEEVLVPAVFPPFERAERVDRLSTTRWNAENFENVRETRYSTDLPHGVIAVNYIEYMSDNLGARVAFSYLELNAAVWIVEELLAMGFDFADIEVQEFDYWDIVEGEIGLMPMMWEMGNHAMMIGPYGRYLRYDRVSQNVVLTLQGQSDYFIVVGAHYDSPPYASASDNASGTALLLESAQRMMELDHYYTIVYVFFGAEEVGLLGAYWYVEQLTQAERDRLVMMVNADVIIEGPYIVYGAGVRPTFSDDEMDAVIDLVFEGMVDMLWGMQDWILEAFGLPADYENADSIMEMVIEAELEHFRALPADTILMQGVIMGMVDFEVNAAAEQVSAIAADLVARYGFNLNSYLANIAGPSDQLAFLFEGFTIVNIFSYERVDNLDPELIALLTRFGEGMYIEGIGDLTITILHTPMDEFHFIEAHWPGMMNANLEAISIFVQTILMSQFN